MRASQAEYISFVDDDDDVHDLYVPLLYTRLREKPDCLSLHGILTTNGQNPQRFVHSIQYNNKYGQEDGVYVRPPNHLNPIKRSLAIECLFPENNYGEDRAWALALAAKGLLKHELAIEVPYYFYQYDGKYHGIKDHEEKKPRVSIITSVYKGDEFIEGFLADIVRQTIFDDCELIIINANSPGHEEPIIQQYCQKYPNIVYERLAHDPGLYGVWNYGIRKARADLVTNANVDDRRNPRCLEEQACALEGDDSVDLVYAPVYLTLIANQTFESNSHYGVMNPADYSPRAMLLCLPGPMPMWRKSVHLKYGYFDESYISSGDFEFWNRLALNGVQFKKLSGMSGIFYQNPHGLSTDKNPAKVERRMQEDLRIWQIYRAMWSGAFCV
jgi:GT2 family glycosyltransferase